MEVGISELNLHVQSPPCYTDPHSVRFEYKQHPIVLHLRKADGVRDIALVRYRKYSGDGKFLATTTTWVSPQVQSKDRTWKITGEYVCASCNWLTNDPQKEKGLNEANGTEPVMSDFEMEYKHRGAVKGN